jgi:hypothetical protein
MIPSQSSCPTPFAQPRAVSFLFQENGLLREARRLSAGSDMTAPASPAYLVDGAIHAAFIGAAMPPRTRPTPFRSGVLALSRKRMKAHARARRFASASAATLAAAEAGIRECYLSVEQQETTSRCVARRADAVRAQLRLLGGGLSKCAVPMLLAEHLRVALGPRARESLQRECLAARILLLQSQLEADVAWDQLAFWERRWHAAAHARLLVHLRSLQRRGESRGRATGSSPGVGRAMEMSLAEV